MSETKFTNTVVNMQTKVPQMGIAGLMYGTPAGIVASEIEGQHQLAESDVLPIKNKARAVFEAWGFEFGGPVADDPLFEFAKLPDGWSKRIPTDHDMWVHVLDERGHKRAHLFFKASAHDRKAEAYLDKRMHVGTSYDDRESTFGYVQTSDGVTIYKTETVVFAAEARAEVEDDWLHNEKLRGSVEEQAQRWMEKNYPDHASFTAYWELDVENGERPGPSAASKQ